MYIAIATYMHIRTYSMEVTHMTIVKLIIITLLCMYVQHFNITFTYACIRITQIESCILYLDMAAVAMLIYAIACEIGKYNYLLLQLAT